MKPITKQEATTIIDKNGFIKKGEFDVTWEDVKDIVKCDLLENGYDLEDVTEFMNSEARITKYVKKNWGHI